MYQIKDVLTSKELSIFRSQNDKYRRTYDMKGNRTNEEESLLEKIASFIILSIFFAIIVWIANNVSF